MTRTRKLHLAPMAQQLALSGLSVSAIAAQLGVNHSTIWRWMITGRVDDRRARSKVPVIVGAMRVGPGSICKCGAFKSPRAPLCRVCYCADRRSYWNFNCACGGRKSKNAARCQSCAWRRLRKLQTCEWCRESFWRPLRQAETDARRYCSKRCYGYAKSIYGVSPSARAELAALPVMSRESRNQLTELLALRREAKRRLRGGSTDDGTVWADPIPTGEGPPPFRMSA
ncbi:MAG: helix-turn-helix domain-containing protein [Planctomycetota bacterium]|nr:MAG: helix-turn-helix domain-containing protein [Planctomycetota bacterium]